MVETHLYKSQDRDNPRMEILLAVAPCARTPDPFFPLTRHRSAVIPDPGCVPGRNRDRPGDDSRKERQASHDDQTAMAHRPITIDALRIGMHVAKLDVAWFRSPFMRHSFLIRTDEQSRSSGVPA